MPEGQHVIRPHGGLVPGGSHRDVAADEVLIGQRLDPREAIRVGPHRVVHAGEVGVDLAAALHQEVRQQDGELVGGHRELVGPQEFVPRVVPTGHGRTVWDELVPPVGAGAALLANASGEHREKEQRTSDGPPAEVARRCGSPRVRGHLAAAPSNDLRNPLDLLLGDPALGRGEGEGVLRVIVGERLLERLEVLSRLVGVQLAHVGLPVDPAVDVVPVHLVGAHQVRRHRE